MYAGTNCLYRYAIHSAFVLQKRLDLSRTIEEMGDEFLTLVDRGTKQSSAKVSTVNFGNSSQSREAWIFYRRSIKGLQNCVT